MGDLFVGETLAEEVDDLPFARGEDVWMGRSAALAHGEISLRRRERIFTLGGSRNS